MKCASPCSDSPEGVGRREACGARELRRCRSLPRPLGQRGPSSHSPARAPSPARAGRAAAWTAGRARRAGRSPTGTDARIASGSGTYEGTRIGPVTPGGRGTKARGASAAAGSPARLHAVHTMAATPTARTPRATLAAAAPSDVVGEEPPWRGRANGPSAGVPLRPPCCVGVRSWPWCIGVLRCRTRNGTSDLGQRFVRTLADLRRLPR
jgi:hypothetical protein